MAISIPQKESVAKRKQRLNNINAQKTRYEFEHPAFPTSAKIKSLPSQEMFDGRYMSSIHARYLKLFANAADVAVRQVMDPFDNLQDFDDLFPLLPRPSTLRTWREDHAFAEQRLSGVNPIMLRRVTSLTALPADSKVSDADVVRALGPGHSLAASIAEKRLFVVDHAGLARVPWGPGPSGFRMLPAPFALFYWRTLTGDGARGELVPVAIQIARGAGDHRVFTPFDAPNDWLVAKLAFQVADGNQHEMGTHLGLTHLILECVPVAVARTLAPNHPVSVLLRPHVKFLLAINEDARAQLIGAGGRIHRLLAGTLDGSLGIADDVIQSFRFANQAIFPREIAARGVEDTNTFPHYPYRDDGLLIWNAVESYVRAYVSLYYGNDNDVVQDPEIQEFVRVLAADDGGRWKMLNVDGTNNVRTRDALTSLIAGIIWTSGPQHAAVNYPQWDCAGFPPNQPLALYKSPPGKAASPTTTSDLLQYLPPSGLASEQIQVMYFLGTYRYDQLGHHPAGTFVDPRVTPVIVGFQQSLARAEAEIRRRNQTRRTEYVTLLPSLIPNSTSV